jgi:hypothetical protein
MKTIAITALVTAATCFGITATTGFASHRTASGTINVPANDTVVRWGKQSSGCDGNKLWIACGRLEDVNALASATHANNKRGIAAALTNLVHYGSVWLHINPPPGKPRLEMQSPWYVSCTAPGGQFHFCQAP